MSNKSILWAVKSVHRLIRIYYHVRSKYSNICNTVHRSKKICNLTVIIGRCIGDVVVVIVVINYVFRRLVGEGCY